MFDQCFKVPFAIVFRQDLVIFVADLRVSPQQAAITGSHPWTSLLKSNWHVCIQKRMLWFSYLYLQIQVTDLSYLYVPGWGTSATPSTQSWWCSSGVSSLPGLRWPETSGTLWWASASNSSPTSELPPPWDNEPGRGSEVRGKMFAVVPRHLCSGLLSRIKRNTDGATWPSPQLSKCYISPLYLAFHSKTQGMDLFRSTTLRLTCGGPHRHSAHFRWVRPPLELTAPRLSAC